MTMLKLFGLVLFCSLLSPSQEVLSGLSCAVSPTAMQHVLADAILRNGLLQQHLQGLVLPNIMGEGGLLNSPTSITGLHLAKMRRPKLLVGLLSGIGMQLSITARLELSGTCLVDLISELISISVDVNVTASIKCTNFESGTVQVVIEDCLCLLGTVKIKLLSGLLSLSVNDLVLSKLTTTMPSMLCPILDIILSVVNIRLLDTVNAVIPVGTAGTIHYQLASLPFASSLFLRLDLDGVVKQVGGTVIPHDSSPSDMPPLLNNLLVLVLRPSFLSAILSLILQIQPLTLTCTPEAFSGASSLEEAITALIPAECSACGGPGPLSIKLTLAGNPLILLEDNKATIKVSVLIRVFVKRAGGPSLTLLLLKADVSLDTVLSLAGGRLMLGVSLGRISLSLESSEVGVSNVS
ncbi:BPI fold-containing family B member 4, partial [Mesitornis unicolor]